MRPATWAVFVRSFAVQGSWNYRTLLGTGFVFALLPVLRSLYGAQPERLREAVARHGGLFNSHPYLAPIALGAVARMEQDGEDPALIERFKAAVRGSLGTFGDRLVWAGWRPVCLLISLALLLLDAPWWLVAGSFLVVYNAGHLAVRAWSFRLGLREGKRVGEGLRHSPLGRVSGGLLTAGAFLAGLVLPLAVVHGLLPAGTGLRLPTDDAGIGWVVAGGVAAAAGARWGAKVRAPAIALLTVFVVMGVAMGVAA